MHEAGIAQQVIDACAVHARNRGGSRVTGIGLRIGALASVDPESLRFCFDSLKQDTALAAAVLEIEWRSRFGCTCGQAAIALEDQPGRCPGCGAAESFADACALDIQYLEFDDGADHDDQHAG